MNIYSEVEIQKINIYIGCRLRLERLKRSLSQHEVGVKSGTDSTAVGRIERAEHVSTWVNIMQVSRCLGINFVKLFELKTKEELINIVNECYSYESKLTKEKEKYYSNLLTKIDNL